VALQFTVHYMYLEKQYMPQERIEEQSKERERERERERESFAHKHNTDTLNREPWTRSSVINLLSYGLIFCSSSLAAILQNF